MRLPDSFRFALAAGLLAAAGTIGLGQQPSPVPASGPSVALSVRAEEFVLGKQVMRLYLNCDTNKAVVLVPTDFRADASTPGKATFTAPDGSCFLGIRLVPDGGLSPEAVRLQALRRFPGAVVSREHNEFVCGRSAPGLDLTWASSSGTSQSVRVAYAATPFGILEFSAISGAPGFKSTCAQLSVLLASFRTNEGGKLEIVPVPDKS
ncbi:MAG: hypothetical protein U1F98_10660 [Verrucomicrobiota bacterium]